MRGMGEGPKTPILYALLRTPALTLPFLPPRGPVIPPPEDELFPLYTGPQVGKKTPLSDFLPDLD